MTSKRSPHVTGKIAGLRAVQLALSASAPGLRAEPLAADTLAPESRDLQLTFTVAAVTEPPVFSVILESHDDRPDGMFSDRRVRVTVAPR